MGTEPDLTLIHGEVGQAATEPKQLLARVPVPLVLPDRVAHRLLGQAVLQFEGSDRQAVDEQSQVECLLAPLAVAELPGNGETVLLEEPLGPLVLGRGGTVAEIQVEGPVLDPVAEQLDGAPLVDLTPEPGQEAAPGRTIFIES